MNFQLINPVNEKFSALEQVLYNRGIQPQEFHHYLNTTDADVAPPERLGEANLMVAAKLIQDCMHNHKKVCVVVDSDNDGFTSAAMLINYLYKCMPLWVEDCVYYFMHDGKQHGLSDFPIDEVNSDELSLVILPDAGSNDIEQMRALYMKNINVICLDHHLYDEKAVADGIIINSQYECYTNKELSGAGVTYQFCKYLDKTWGHDFADYFLDLCAVGNAGDMMSLKSIETKHLVNKGVKQLNNPFISYLAEKNDYSISKKGGMCYDAIGWYISPFINAIVRSGTQQEKQLVFESMLEHRAYQIIPSNKRGHKPGDTEQLVVQVMRLVTNVKNRQQKAVDAGMSLLEALIESDCMLQHKVLLFLLDKDDIDANIRGLSGNKIMSKYQRPVCVLTKGTDRNGNVIYQGSARGCELAGIESFMNICRQTGLCNYLIGHDNAFGLSLNENDIDKFIDMTDILLKDMSPKPIYYCDFIYYNQGVNADDILTIARYPELWGKDFHEPIVGIASLKVTKEMLTLMAKNTLKIQVGDVSLIKFSISDEEFESLYSEHGSVEVNLVGTCHLNEWMGNTSAQIMIDDLEIVGEVKWVF